MRSRDASGIGQRPARVVKGGSQLFAAATLASADCVAGLDAETAMAILALLPLALVVIDRAMRVLWASPSAWRILRAGDPLVVVGERLRIRAWSRATPQRSGTNSRTLEGPASASAEIGSLISMAERDGDAAVAIGRMTRPGSLFVRVMRLAGSGDAFLLQLAERDEPPAISPSIARQIFGLTAVEAKLAALVAEGAPLGRAAAALRISAGTARNHLKSIFRKTGVRRQSDLVRLLLATSVARETRR